MANRRKPTGLYFVIIICLTIVGLTFSIASSRYKEEKDLSDIKSTSGVITENGNDGFLYVIINDVKYEFQYGARWSVDTSELNKIIEVGKTISIEYIEFKSNNGEILVREIVSMSQGGETIFTLENYKQSFENYKNGTGRVIVIVGGVSAIIIALLYTIVAIYNYTPMREKSSLSGLVITDKGFILRSTNLSYKIVYMLNYIFVLIIIIILALFFSKRIAFVPFIVFLSIAVLLEALILFSLYSVNRLMFKLENEKYYYRKTFGKTKEIAIKDISKIIIGGITGEGIKFYDKNNNVVIKINNKYFLTGGAFLNSIIVRNIPCKFLRFYSISYCIDCIEQEIKYDNSTTIKKIFEDKKLDIDLIMYDNKPSELFNLISILKVLNIGNEEDYEYLTTEINKLIEKINSEKGKNDKNL